MENDSSYKNKRLLIIINDRLSDLINKGEVTSRYYNPGNVFDEVYILLLNHDKVSKIKIQKMVGTAKLEIINFNTPKLLLLLFYVLPFLQKIWFNSLLKKINEINPNIVRCYSIGINTILAKIIKEKLKIPYLVSLHINFDQNIYSAKNSLSKKIYYYFLKKIEKDVLGFSELVMPVYSTIIPYLNRLKLENYKIFYNSVNPENLILKKNYQINFNEIKIISVGRIFKEKFPIEVIKAVLEIKNAFLTVVGDGDLQEELVNKTKILDTEGRIKFIKSIPNDVLAESLHDYDLFVTHSDYLEVSKSLIEAMVVGLPIIINKPKEVIKEVEEAGIICVENMKKYYKEKIEELILDDKKREAYGITIARYANSFFSPEKTEIRTSSLYKEMLTYYSKKQLNSSLLELTKH